MNWRPQLVLLLAIATVSFAADAPKPKTGTVQGSVSDAAKGTPLANADVTLYPVRTYIPGGPAPATIRAASSGPEGQFTIEDIAPGQYFLTARKNGFIDRTYGSRATIGSSGIPITITSGSTVKELSLSLLPGAVISGTIENEDGEPFADVTVRALQYRYRWPGKHLAIVASTTTNDHGEYRLHGLMPGSYFVVCSTYRPRVLKENGISTPARYPVTFYPSVTTIQTAVATPVKAGDEAIVKISLAATRTYTVRGKITGNDPESKMVLAMRQLLEGIVSDSRRFTVGDNGSYQVDGILPGDYQLLAMGKSRGQTSSGKRKITIEDRDLNDVLITLESQRPPIPGRIMTYGWLDKGGLKATLVPGTAVDDQDDESTIMALRPATPAGSPITDRYGQFTAAELTQDAQTVFATVQSRSPGFEDFYVSAVKLNGEDVTNTGFNPSRAGYLEIEYLNNGGRLEGTVAAVDGQAIPGATVVLIPDDSRRGRRDLYRVLRADQKGEFVIRGVAPGKYTIVAWEGEIENDAIYDTDYMKPYLALSKAQSIEVTARGKSFVVLGAISVSTDAGAQ